MELQRADELSCSVSDNRPDEVFILTVALTKIDIPQLTVNSVSTHKKPLTCCKHLRSLKDRTSCFLSLLVDTLSMPCRHVRG